MIRSTLAIAASVGLTVAFAATQGRRFQYSDGSMTVLSTSGRAELGRGDAYHFFLKGAVSIASLAQGLTLTADTVTCDTALGANKKTELRHAVATGGVHMVKTVTNKVGKQTTDITGTRADMQSAPNGSIVNLAGPVKIVSLDQVKRKTMTATGRSAVAVLEPGSKSSLSSGIRGATLQGPVHLVMVQSKAGTQGDSTLVADADRMEMKNLGKVPQVVLIGHVSGHGEGASRVGRFSGMTRATIQLNAQGEVTGFGTEAG
ncbi:hypothetical protein [Fimbriimonas ginsengisoli]|uniref:OstA family protein n=1 Tax=Fimbriimonas ginsengisoli Gsoil 348 TaxID=661478 RepID=A0A068NVJ9_FIMGI|nr:hypothetical protein [Fimbriimonas ginsengisoli]AIE85589.1 hypothetical protein OP10G_2221 [Fimbriimonas ginsengisoli Gsoil 348]